MKTFGQICFVILATILSSLMGGFLFMTLWGWFVVYTFHIAPVTMIQAVGLSFFVSYVKRNITKDEDEEEITTEMLVRLFIYNVLWFGVTLGLGYIVTLFQ